MIFRDLRKTLFSESNRGMLYLAEHIHKRRTWLTMLLANSAVIARVVLGL